MIIEVDASSGVPPYEQVRVAIERAITGGDLACGTRLPTVRALAANLTLAPNTIARAYRELEALGLVVGQGRRGTFVVDRTAASAAVDAEAGADPGAVRAAAEAYAREVRELGVGPEAALRMVRGVLGL